MEKREGITPTLAIREGDKVDAVIEHIKSDPEIGVLVVGAGVDKAGPGPLVSRADRPADGRAPGADHHRARLDDQGGDHRSRRERRDRRRGFRVDPQQRGTGHRGQRPDSRGPCRARHRRELRHRPRDRGAGGGLARLGPLGLRERRHALRRRRHEPLSVAMAEAGVSPPIEDYALDRRHPDRGAGRARRLDRLAVLAALRFRRLLRGAARRRDNGRWRIAPDGRRARPGGATARHPRARDRARDRRRRGRGDRLHARRTRRTPDVVRLVEGVRGQGRDARWSS